MPFYGGTLFHIKHHIVNDTSYITTERRHRTNDYYVKGRASHRLSINKTMLGGSFTLGFEKRHARWFNELSFSINPYKVHFIDKTYAQFRFEEKVIGLGGQGSSIKNTLPLCPNRGYSISLPLAITYKTEFAPLDNAFFVGALIGFQKCKYTFLAEEITTRNITNYVLKCGPTFGMRTNLSPRIRLKFFCDIVFYLGQNSVQIVPPFQSPFQKKYVVRRTTRPTSFCIGLGFEYLL